MNNLVKNIGCWVLAIIVMTACNPEDVKRDQSIYFEEIAPQMLIDGSVQLKATASSGLPVIFASADSSIVTVEGNRAIFHTKGKVQIYASQPGNDEFYEAPNVSQQLLIRDWDPNKKNQSISFDLPNEWQLSRDGGAVELLATASSGLPVKFTFSGPKAGFISSSGRYLYLYHGGETEAFLDVYDTLISIIASQEGNDEYNPADNEEREMHIIGDVLH